MRFVFSDNQHLLLQETACALRDCIISLTIFLSYFFCWGPAKTRRPLFTKPPELLPSWYKNFAV